MYKAATSSVVNMLHVYGTQLGQLILIEVVLEFYFAALTTIYMPNRIELL